MNNNLKILLIFLLTLFITQQNLLAADPVIVGPDTSIVRLICSKEYVAVPYILLAKAGSLVKFEAISGGYSVLFKNADRFFEDVDQTLTIKIDSNGDAESEIFIIKSDLPAGTEIEYTVVCLKSGKIVDAPPKIIIVPADDEY